MAISKYPVHGKTLQNTARFGQLWQNTRLNDSPRKKLLSIRVVSLFLFTALSSRGARHRVEGLRQRSEGPAKVRCGSLGMVRHARRRFREGQAVHWCRMCHTLISIPLTHVSFLFDRSVMSLGTQSYCSMISGVRTK